MRYCLPLLRSTATTVNAGMASPGKAKPPVIEPANADVKAIKDAASATPYHPMLVRRGDGCHEGRAPGALVILIARFRGVVGYVAGKPMRTLNSGICGCGLTPNRRDYRISGRAWVTEQPSIGTALAGLATVMLSLAFLLDRFTDAVSRKGTERLVGTQIEFLTRQPKPFPGRRPAILGCLPTVLILWCVEFGGDIVRQRTEGLFQLVRGSFGSAVVSPPPSN